MFLLWVGKEASSPLLFSSHDGEQPDDTNNIKDQDYPRVDAQVEDLTFGAED